MILEDVARPALASPGSCLVRPSPGARRSWEGLDRDVRPCVEGLDAAELASLVAILEADVTSEFDARFLRDHLRSLDLPFTAEFRRVEERWVEDEERHYRCFHLVLEQAFGHDAGFFAGLAERRPDFGPIAHLFADEFSIACLGAYDELATVRAFRANLPHYDRLGPRFRRFIRAVIADEGWHYAMFLDVLQRRHPHRLAEAPAVVARIRATEGTAYGNTFVLDHDDDVFDETIYDEAAQILLRHLRQRA